MKVLFLCSGNICRSPMAAEYFRQRASQSGLSHVVVDSAGTLGIVGSPASAEAIAAMREEGIDLTSHRSKGLTGSMLRSTDLVVAMAHDHVDYLAHHHPDEPARRLLLRAFEQAPQPDPNAPDLEDPIGKPLKAYRDLLPVIRRSVDHLILHLKYPS
jgi:protein-tyrosine-phosphatase